MAKSSKQKLKLLYLMKCLLEKTDETHMLTVPEMISYLESMGVSAERKSIYDDIEALRLYGLDVEMKKSKTTGYYIANRAFELPELKLLVDSVQSSKFITHRKSNELIKKIESFASVYEAQLLQRQVYVANRIKTMNESIYYNVDKIHSGIGENKKISFKYFEYDINKQKKYRHEGKRYEISPLALTWDDENYYMLGFDSEAEMIKHYRVDKMESIELTKDKRDGIKEFKSLDMAIYSKKIFSMFGGRECAVKLRFENHLVGVVLDRYGKDITIIKDGAEHFTVIVNVFLSPQFYGWLFGMGESVKIISPQEVVEEMSRKTEGVLEKYKNKE